MTDLAGLIAGLPARPDTAALLAEFIPPRRFVDKSFASYHPQHPSQEAAQRRLREMAVDMRRPRGPLRRLRDHLGGGPARGGVYLDGGFGVGKTHLLAALWNEAPGPKSYLSFDELVYFIGLVGVERASRAFADRRLVAVDEWELDDPGNLKLALAFLRAALADGVRVAVTSNTLPLELGAGRFSQKDFRAEIEELAVAFEVVRVEGTDYRHRHFEADPGLRYFLPPAELERGAVEAGEGSLLVDFGALVAALAGLHPIRYAGLVERIGSLWIREMQPIAALSDALRWVHFVDTLYDSGVPLKASSRSSLAALFPPDTLSGPYGKKASRCLSRMEELLAGG